MMQAIRWQPVKLASSYDNEAMLAYRSDRLVAVVSKLGELHDDIIGWWFVEATFDCMHRAHVSSFKELSEVEAWIMSV